MANNHKRMAESMSVRFSGKYLELLDEIKELSTKTEQSNNNVMRYLMAIGLEAYKRGAIAGFDGKVIISNDASEVNFSSPLNASNIVVQEYLKSEIKVPSKKINSNFID